MPYADDAPPYQPRVIGFRQISARAVKYRRRDAREIMMAHTTFRYGLRCVRLIEEASSYCRREWALRFSFSSYASRLIAAPFHNTLARATCESQREMPFVGY